MSINKGLLSIAGLYTYDDEIFSGLTVPDGVSKGLVCNNILLECGELNLLYPDWNYMCAMILQWSMRELPDWERIWKLAQMEYNPIENYDRHESSTDKSQSRKNRAANESNHADTTGQTESNTSGSSSGQNSDSNAHNVAGFNNDQLATAYADDTVRLNSTTDENSSKANTAAKNTSFTTAFEGITDDGTTAHTSRIHGNIGVTTTQQMMQQEIEIAPQLNLVRIIVESFKREFCILVY